MITEDKDLVKIWSFEHDAWWRAARMGYTNDEAQAGLYPRTEAEKICAGANYGGTLNEEIVELRVPPLKIRVAALIREINSQDNRATASPYYFAVQTKKWVDTDFGGDEEKKVIHYDGSLYTLEEWLASPEYNLKSVTIPEGDEAYEDAVSAAEAEREETLRFAADEWERNHPFLVRAEYVDKEIFLTESAAKQYMQANAHHLCEPRTYVKHFWRNSQMEMVMRALEEFSGEKLEWK